MIKEADHFISERYFSGNSRFSRERYPRSSILGFLWVSVILLSEVVSGQAPVRTLYETDGFTAIITEIYSYQGIVYASSADGYLKAFNDTTGHFIATMGWQYDWIDAMVGHENTLITGGWDGHLRFWSTASLAETRIISNGWCAALAIWSGNLIAVSASNIRMYDISANYALLRTLNGHTANIKTLTIINDILWSGSEDSTIRRWDLSNDGAFLSSSVHGDWVIGIHLWEGRMVSTGASIIKHWNVTTGALMQSFNSMTSSPRVTVLQGNFLLTATGISLRKFNLLTNTYEWTSSSPVFSVFADGNKFWSGNYDLKQWNGTTLQPIWTAGLAPMRVTSVRSNVGFLYAGTSSGMIVEYRISDGVQTRQFNIHLDQIWYMLPQGGFLYSGSADTYVKKVDLRTGVTVQTYNGHIDSVVNILVAGTTIITASDDNTVKVWNEATSELLGTINAPTSMTTKTALGFDGTYLFIAADRNTNIEVYDLSTGTRARTFGRRSYFIYMSGFIIQAEGSAVEIMNPSTGAVTQTLDIGGYEIGDVHAMDICSDYAFFGMRYGSSAVVMFNWRTGSYIRTFTNSLSWVQSISMGDDGVLFVQNEKILQYFVPELVGVTCTSNSVPETKTTSTRTTRKSRSTTRTSTIRTSTTKPSIEDPDDQSDVASSNASLTTQYVIIGVIVTFAIISAYFVTAWYFKRQSTKRVRTKTKKIRHSGTHTKLSTESHEPESTHQTVTVGGTTLRPASAEISFPVFLECRWGIDFRQGEFVAKGGNASIHTAISLSTDLRNRSAGSDLAIKVVSNSLEVMVERERAAFLQEISLMWRFQSHPAFVAIYGYSTRPVTMVMKLYRLGDLSEFIEHCGSASKRYPYSKATVVSLLRQICLGIAFMHANGVVHCDIKPANFLLDTDPLSNHHQLSVRIGDLGIAKIVEQQSANIITGFQLSDLRGASIAYAAPESITRFRQRLAEPNSDIWKGGDAYAISMCVLHVVNRHSPWSRRK